jgi:RNase P protein component
VNLKKSTNRRIASRMQFKAQSEHDEACHSEPFDFAQDRLRRGGNAAPNNFRGEARLSISIRKRKANSAGSLDFSRGCGIRSG